MTSPDILDLDFDAYLDRIRRLTDEELIPGEAAMVELGEVPPPLVDRLAECGLFGITLPRHWGGLGWSMEQQVRLTFEFTRASPVYRSRFSTTIGLCSQILHDHGTDEQKERYLRDMAIGRCVASFALTETGAGSDATAVTTTAVRDGDQYVINGHKRFITNGAWADLLVVFVRTGDAGFSAILVPADTPGVTATLPSRMNGHEAGPVAELSFTDVHVPTTNLVGDEGAGLKLALRGSHSRRLRHPPAHRGHRACPHPPPVRPTHRPVRRHRGNARQESRRIGGRQGAGPGLCEGMGRRWHPLAADRRREAGGHRDRQGDSRPGGPDPGR